MIAFLIWALFGLSFLVLGFYVFHAKTAKAFGFWANADVFPVEDVKSYNQALGKMWCVFGIIFILLGLPLLSGQNSPYIFLSLFGVMLEAIVIMVIYITKIEAKYRKR